MKILFLAAQLYLPQLYGGVQTSTDQLCHALIGRGHKVALLTKLMPGGYFGWKSRLHMYVNKRLKGCKVAKDIGYGYPVWRTWFPKEAIAYVCQKEKPDLIVVMSGGEFMPVAFEAQATGIPILVQLHDVALNEYGESFGKLHNTFCVANSNFTAEKYHHTYGIAPSVIYPFIATAQYRIHTLRENVTFINPVRVKGCEIALEIARLCPEIPFSFVEGWTLSNEQRAELQKKLSGLANVTFLPSQKDMRAVYNNCKILLVPSTYEETFGRVVTEAQVSGIPVIASARGGLPESVGQGGIVIDPDGPVETWVEAIRKLWNDNTYYAKISTAALAHAQRSEMNIEYQTDAWENAMRKAIGDFGNTRSRDNIIK